MEQASAPAGFDAQAVAVWAQYAKERCDAQEKRLADLRGWARRRAGDRVKPSR